MILCVGTTPVWQRSMEFGRFEIGAVNRAVAVHDYASGKSINVAKVLQTLGETPRAVSFIGGDRGAALAADLAAKGVDHDFVTTPAETRQCVTIIDRAAGTATELVEEAAAVDAEDWAKLDSMIEQHWAAARGAVFSGSLPPAAPVDCYARWIAAAGGRGTPILLDTRGEPLRQALRCGGFIAKLNRDELATTLGEPIGDEMQLRQAMRRIVPAGGAAMVTHGAESVWAMRGKNLFHVRPPKVKAVSAVGSGDAFAAGFISALVAGDDFAEALKLAAACGAANALTAHSGELRMDDVRALRPQVEVNRVEA